MLVAEIVRSLQEERTCPPASMWSFRLKSFSSSWAFSRIGK